MGVARNAFSQLPVWKTYAGTRLLTFNALIRFSGYSAGPNRLLYPIAGRLKLARPDLQAREYSTAASFEA
ncbi:MAG: hypothetical protein QOJ99_4396 [Bryobacterales bacterium]|jgi:hypothetical protein|nr:hypothetical protein [Bryobacterales bacterium]